MINMAEVGYVMHMAIVHYCLIGIVIAVSLITVAHFIHRRSKKNVKQTTTD
jgi:hypothetical protein